jgi:putative transposase
MLVTKTTTKWMKMALKPDIIPIRRLMHRLFPRSTLMSLARETGAVTRHRKVDIVALFWTVVLGFAVQRQRTLASLRRGYQKSTGQEIQESSFYDRFNKGFARMLQAAVANLLTRESRTGRKLSGALSRFKDVVLTDATVLKLHWFLAREFPGTRTHSSPAAAKLHVVMSVTGKSQQSVRLTTERVHDAHVLKIGPWVRGRLLLFDLGYFKYQLFARIDLNGGAFVSRLKSSSNPQITHVNRCHRGQPIDLEGRRLKEVLPKLKRSVIDVMVRVRFQRRRYAGKRRWDTMSLRLVGSRNQETRKWQLYLTNVPVSDLAAEDVSGVYAARWQIELLFAQLKGAYHLDHLPSSKPEIVEALIYASILTLLVSQRLLASFRRHLQHDAGRVPEQRWARVFSSVAQDLLRIVTWPPRHAERLQKEIATMILHESIDPHLNRPGLIDAVGSGKHKCCHHPIKPPCSYDVKGC